MSTPFLLPALPGGPARVLRWLCPAATPVAAGDPLVIVLTADAEIGLPAPVSGVVSTLDAPEGAVLEPGAVLAMLQATAPAGTGAPRRVMVTPVAARVAAQLQIDPAGLQGSGAGGRVLKRDILAAGGMPAPAGAALAAGAAAPVVEPARVSATVVLPVAAPHGSVPYVHTAREVDLSAWEQLAALHGPALAALGLPFDPLVGVLYAVAGALPGHPLVNACWDDDGIIVRRRIHLAVSAYGRCGLICDAGDLNVRGLARALRDRQPGAGATFSVVQRDAYAALPGGEQPLTGAVLTLGAVERRVVVDESGGVEQLRIRPRALLVLAYDARLLSQPRADAFLADVAARCAALRWP